MTIKLAPFLAAALLLGGSGGADASVDKIDILTATGVPGTGGTLRIDGPCYCTTDGFFSPVMLLQPGTYDFGQVRE